MPDKWLKFARCVHPIRKSEALCSRLTRGVGLEMGKRHMQRFATLLPSLLIMGGCVTELSQVAVPDEVIGTISGPSYSGWNQDLCNEGQVTRSLPACAPLGPGVYEMEIYKVTLNEIRTLDGKKVSPRLAVGLVAHSLRKDYRERRRIRLEKAPENFRAATGIEYLAWTYVTPNTSLERTRDR